MKYNYKFQNLLDYKETIENFKKSEYGKALSIYTEEEKALQQIEQEKNRIVDIIDGGETLNIREMRLYSGYLNKVTKDRDQQEEVVEDSQEQVKQAQMSLMMAMQEKKVFEKLKEKHFKEFLVEEKRKEDKIVDEIVTFKTRTQ